MNLFVFHGSHCGKTAKKALIDKFSPNIDLIDVRRGLDSLCPTPCERMRAMTRSGPTEKLNDQGQMSNDQRRAMAKCGARLSPAVARANLLAGENGHLGRFARGCVRTFRCDRPSRTIWACCGWGQPRSGVWEHSGKRRTKFANWVRKRCGKVQIVRLCPRLPAFFWAGDKTCIGVSECRRIGNEKRSEAFKREILVHFVSLVHASFAYLRLADGGPLEDFDFSTAASAASLGHG